MDDVDLDEIAKNVLNAQKAVIRNKALLEKYGIAYDDDEDLNDDGYLEDDEGDIVESDEKQE